MRLIYAQMKKIAHIKELRSYIPFIAPIDFPINPNSYNNNARLDLPLPFHFFYHKHPNLDLCFTNSDVHELK